MLTRDSRASDLRDKVYALLGLLTSTERAACGIQPNYTSSNTKADVYIEAAKAGLIGGKDIWFVLGEVSGAELDAGLPSWAPNWCQGRESHISMFFENGPFDAGGKVLSVPEFLEADRVMKLRGFSLGAIDRIGEVDEDHNQRSSEIIESWARYLKRDTQGYFLPHELVQFFRTISLNTYDEEDLPDPDGDRKIFYESWVRKLLILTSGKGGRRHCLYRRFFRLSNGQMGLGCRRAKQGDVACIVPGCKIPLLIRKSPRNKGRYSFIGECFVFDFMHGETLDMYRNGKTQETIIYVE